MGKTLIRGQNPGLTTTYITPHICGACGSHIAEDWVFCPECGTPTGLDPTSSTRYMFIRSMSLREMADPQSGIVSMVQELCEDGCPGPELLRSWLERPMRGGEDDDVFYAE